MSSEEKICLQWKEFQTNIKTSYRGLRKTEDYADVTLACDDGQLIRAHRNILSLSSLFFRDVLSSLSHSHPLVYMRGMKHQDLSNMIGFIYHGEVEVRNEELETFLSIAGELSVKGTKTKIAKKLKREDTSEPEEEEEGEKKKHFECEPCGKTYRTRDLLRTHIYNHNKNLQDAALVKSEKLEDKDKDDSWLFGSDDVDNAVWVKVD